MYVGVFPACICMQCPVEAIEGGRIPWDWNYSGCQWSQLPGIE